MKAGTTVMMIACGLIALIGLFAAGHAVDIGMTVFGFILLVFGVGMIFLYMKQHFDALDAHREDTAASGERVLDRVA